MKTFLILFATLTLHGCSLFKTVDEKDYAHYISERDASVAECKKRHPYAECIVVIGALPYIKE